MARRHVTATEMMRVERKTPTGKGGFLGWGKYATRKLHNNQTAPKLVAFKTCMQSNMSGKSGSLKDIQEAFRESAHACKAKVANIVS